MKCVALLVFALLIPGIGSAQGTSQFIAGTQPDRRPQNAPLITEVDHDKAWLAQALTGVSEPYPESLDFLQDDQGNWFTPFIHPGMTSPYDIRGWHQKN